MHQSLRSSRNHALLLASLLAATLATAQQPRSDDYGGLGNYPVPSVGGPGEYSYCVTYAKRAWRVGNLIEERAISPAQAKRWAMDGLGKNAAAEEVADFERLEAKEYATSSALAADRFDRCARRLNLPVEPRHKGNAEFCFRSIAPLDLAARMRADGKPQEESKAALTRRHPALPAGFVDSTVKLAYAGPSLEQGSQVIEDSFSECFARAGERQLGK